MIKIPGITVIDFKSIQTFPNQDFQYNGECPICRIHTHCCDLATSLDASKNALRLQNEHNLLVDVRIV